MTELPAELQITYVEDTTKASKLRMEYTAGGAARRVVVIG